jgi:hypothetical protein
MPKILGNDRIIQMTFSDSFSYSISALMWTLGLVLPLLVCSFLPPIVIAIFNKLEKSDSQEQQDALQKLGFILMASLFGTILGFAVKLVGGFTVATGGDFSKAVIAGVATVLVAVFGIVASVFSETGTVSMKRPLGAVSFLIMFLVSGFYWKFLEKMPALPSPA